MTDAPPALRFANDPPWWSAIPHEVVPVRLCLQANALFIELKIFSDSMASVIATAHIPASPAVSPAELVPRFVVGSHTEAFFMDQVKNVHSHPTKNIVETATVAGTFTTLAAGLKTAGLLDTLPGKGPFTVFAPSDAFKKLPHAALEALLKDHAKWKSVLTYHVASDHLLANDLKSGDHK